MDYLEFIARVTSHIPDKGQVMIRYCGLYSNAHRGKIRKAGALSFHPPIIEGEYHVPSRGWAEMIRKVYEVDPLRCPSCGGQMRIKLFCFFCLFVLCFILDLIFFPVISSFQDVSWRKSRKIVRDLSQAQKGNSYLFDAISVWHSTDRCHVLPYRLPRSWCRHQRFPCTWW